MLSFLAHLLVTAALLLLVANLVRGVEVEGWGPAFLGSLVLTLLNLAVASLVGSGPA